MIVPIVAIPPVPIAVVTIATVRVAATMMVVVSSSGVSLPLVLPPRPSSLQREVLGLENRSPVQRNNRARHTVVDHAQRVVVGRAVDMECLPYRGGLACAPGVRLGPKDDSFCGEA